MKKSLLHRVSEVNLSTANMWMRLVCVKLLNMRITVVCVHSGPSAME